MRTGRGEIERRLAGARSFDGLRFDTLRRRYSELPAELDEPERSERDFERDLERDRDEEEREEDELERELDELLELFERLRELILKTKYKHVLQDYFQNLPSARVRTAPATAFLHIFRWFSSHVVLLGGIYSANIRMNWKEKTDN